MLYSTFLGSQKAFPNPKFASLCVPQILRYLADVSDGLVEAVRLAINLKRPLLLEGEPGCGKTNLAKAVAYEFSKRYNVKWSYADWYIKSSDRAQDGLYIYDAVRRLYDAQLSATDPLEKEKIQERLNDPDHQAYIKWGAIGKAFKASQNGQRMVVLIDEIDKADPDFPNDLLLEIEEKRFKYLLKSQFFPSSLLNYQIQTILNFQNPRHHPLPHPLQLPETRRKNISFFPPALSRMLLLL
jgi:MoxR-like ATPase